MKFGGLLAFLLANRLSVARMTRFETKGAR